MPITRPFPTRDAMTFREELKELLGDDGDHRPHEDRDPDGEILSPFDRPFPRQHHIDPHQELGGEDDEENGTDHGRGNGGKKGPQLWNKGTEDHDRSAHRKRVTTGHSRHQDDSRTDGKAHEA